MASESRILFFSFYLLIYIILDVKSQLYSPSDDETCERKTGYLLNSLINKVPLPEEYSYVSKFVFYSGYMNQLGDYDNCIRLNNSDYNTIIVNLNEFTKIYSGLCYFKECGYEYLNKTKIDLVYFLNKSLE
jgi:hypothetical protein